MPNPIRFKARSELVLYVRENAPRKSVARALDDGKFEVLGGFSSLCPFDNGGWALRVDRRQGPMYVGVLVDEVKHCYYVREIAKPSWVVWVGNADSEHVWNVFNGDHPVRYVLEKLTAERRFGSLLKDLDGDRDYD